MDRVKLLISYLDRLIEESEECKPAPVQFKTDGPPKCWKCGTTKTYDIVKGEYCPRCNDWC